MKHITAIFITIFIFIISIPCHAIIFNVESLRVGPNPTIRNKNSIIINYVATLPHSANYYIYSITGELMLQKSYGFNTPTITNAGECQFELVNMSTIANYLPQLYVVIMELITEQETLKKKQYVIIK